MAYLVYIYTITYVLAFVKGDLRKNKKASIINDRGNMF